MLLVRAVRILVHPVKWLGSRVSLSTGDRALLALLLALALVRGLIYVALIPPWQAPDEPYHFSTALLPNLATDAQTADSQWRTLRVEMLASMLQHRFWDFQVFGPVPQTTADRQRLYESAVSARRPAAPRAYIYYGLAWALRPVTHQDVTFQLYWARLLSVLTNLGIVGLAFLVGRRLFPDDRFAAALLPLSIVFHPQNTFITAAVNDGNPAALLASIAVLLLTVLITQGLGWQRVVALGVFVGLAVAAKPTAAYLLPVFLVVVTLTVWQRLRGWWRLALIPLAAGAGYVLIRVSARVLPKLLVLAGLVESAGLLGLVTTLANAPFQRGFFWAFRSFWAFLGWESLPVDDGWVWLLMGLCGLAAAGWVRLALRHVRGRSQDSADTARWRAWLAFAACTLTILLLIALQSVVDKAELYVGRYLFALIIPIVALLVIGWREVVPSGWRGAATVLITSFLIVFDTAVLLHYALPFFYPLWR